MVLPQDPDLHQILNWVAMLLVRNREIIAVTAQLEPMNTSLIVSVDDLSFTTEQIQKFQAVREFSAFTNSKPKYCNSKSNDKPEALKSKLHDKAYVQVKPHYSYWENLPDDGITTSIV
jgi:hypothetical protein